MDYTKIARIIGLVNTLNEKHRVEMTPFSATLYVSVLGAEGTLYKWATKPDGEIGIVEQSTYSSYLISDGHIDYYGGTLEPFAARITEILEGLR